MASSPTNLELDVTVISAKHLKNVNWRHGGDLKPYAVVYLDPDRRSATKPDDSGSTKPVWNETLTLTLNLNSTDPPPILNLDIFHSKPSETPKPLVATLRAPLRNLFDADDLAAAAFAGASAVRTLELRRPSGRPQGKVRIKVTLRERPTPIPEPNYHMPPPPSYYYSAAPPPPPPRDHHTTFSSPPPPASPYSNPVPPPPSQYAYGSYSDPYYSSAPGYYSTGSTRYYSAPPAPAPAPAPAPVRPYYDRYGSGPSAPVDYSSLSSQYQQQKPKGSGRMGVGSGLAVGAVAGALGGLALQEGLKHEEERVTERVESDFTPRDDYSDYRADY